MPETVADGSPQSASAQPAPCTCALVVSVRPLDPRHQKTRKVVAVRSNPSLDELMEDINKGLGPVLAFSTIKVKGVHSSDAPDEVVPGPYSGMTFQVMPHEVGAPMTAQ